MRRTISKVMAVLGLTVLVGAGVTGTVPSHAADPNPVTEWAAIVQPAIHNAAAPRPAVSSEVIHTMVQLAVYDAVVAIEGGSAPFHSTIKAPPGADVRAAVATAAYRTARERVAQSQIAYLDEKYGAYMAGIPEGPAKRRGVEVGESAAAGLLALRASDGFNQTVAYQCSANPVPMGEFEPDGGCGTEPVDAKIAQVKPFTFPVPGQFRPDGPDALDADRWVTDFNEVKESGRKDSTVRTAEQTDIAYFWSAHPYVFWNRNLIGLAVARGLGVADTARLFAMAHTATSDAAIAGYEAKYHYRTWRPRTAIPRAAEDGNPRTEPDPAWTPLLSVNHPEYPSGHAFFSGALIDAVAAFLGTTQFEWTLEADKATVPQLLQNRRTYPGSTAIMDEVDNARIWSGLHYRNSMTEGRALGARIAQHVTTNYFRPAPAALDQLPRTGGGPVRRLAILGLSLAGLGSLLRVLRWRRG